MRRSRASSRRGSTKNATHRSSTTSVTQQMKTQAKREALKPGGFTHNRGRQAVYLTLVNPLDTPDPQLNACKHLKLHHDAIYQFFHTLDGCVICFDTISKGSPQGSVTYVRKLKRTRNKSCRCVFVTEKKGITHAVVVGKRALCWRRLPARHIHRKRIGPYH